MMVGMYKAMPDLHLTIEEMIHSGHGRAGGVELIEQTRQYLRDFADAVKSDDAKTAEQRMLAKYPDYHAKQFLTMLSLPVYFPAQDSNAIA